VRQAARQGKTVRFTALLHHITTDLLKRSYLALARDAAPGIASCASATALARTVISTNWRMTQNLSPTQAKRLRD